MPQYNRSSFAYVVAAISGLALFAAPKLAEARSAPLSCPENMALVGSTCVDKYEGSLVEVSAGGAEQAYSPFEAPNGHAVRAVSRPGVTPQAHISMVEAQRACKASGKRLCHAAEWKNACRGPEKHVYPYGDKRVANACVDTGRASPVRVLKQGRYDSSSMNDPALNQLANTVELTGAAAACTNDYGVHDMVGNVHEWADDGAFHGGYYLDTKINGEGCSYRTTAHAPSYYDYSTGFRCCADATEDAATPGSSPEQTVPETPVSFLGKAQHGERLSVVELEKKMNERRHGKRSSEGGFDESEQGTANRVSKTPVQPIVHG